MFPTVAEYNRTIQLKGSSAFRSLRNIDFIPSRTSPIKIFSYGTGSYAVVFKAVENSNHIAIRCFISAEYQNIIRYRKITAYLKQLQEFWITKIELLEDEMQVQNLPYPVIKMDWVEGRLLNQFISENLYNNDILDKLQKKLLEVSTSLEKNHVAHGDIQCGNIIVRKDLDDNVTIKLIDYDGMFIPDFYNTINPEQGRSEFQHPLRAQMKYDEKIDRFSFWVIICGLEALKLDKSLWKEIMQGGYNNLDNILFTGNDFRNFSQSALIQRLYRLNSLPLSYYLNKLKQFSSNDPSKTEALALYTYEGHISEIAKNKITNVTDEYHSSKKLDIVSKPSAAAVLSSNFERIGNTPLSISIDKFCGQNLIITYGTEFRRITVTNDDTIIEIDFKLDKTVLNTQQVVQIDDQQVNAPPITNISVQTTPKKENNYLGYTVLVIMIILGCFAISELLNQPKISSPVAAPSMEKSENNPTTNISTTTYTGNNNNKISTEPIKIKKKPKRKGSTSTDDAVDKIISNLGNNPKYKSSSER